jgi:hypothetical protein
MYAETRKLYLIEELLKVNSDALLNEIEMILVKSHSEKPHKRSFTDFVGMISSEEADELKRIIDDGCEQVNEDDWK